MTASVIKKFLRSTRIIKLISELEIKIRSEREAKHAFSSITIPRIPNGQSRFLDGLQIVDKRRNS